MVKFSPKMPLSFQIFTEILLETLMRRLEIYVDVVLLFCDACLYDDNFTFSDQKKKIIYDYNR